VALVACRRDRLEALVIECDVTEHDEATEAVEPLIGTSSTYRHPHQGLKPPLPLGAGTGGSVLRPRADLGKQCASFPAGSYCGMLEIRPTRLYSVV
jgi:hypothetical protein